MPLLEVRNVCKSFEGNRVLNEVNISFDRGEYVILAGANGSGKTVLMKHLNGLHTPDSGEVCYRGKPIFSDINRVRSRVGLVFQHSDMQFVGQNVFDEIAFGPENLGYSRQQVKEMVMKIAENLNLAAILTRRPHELSGGEKKRLAIASVVVMDPEIILLDEPFAGLDYPGVISILHTLDHLYQAGHTLVVITHDLEKVLGCATRMTVMKSGAIVYDSVPLIDEMMYRENALYVPYGNNRDVKSLRWS